MPLRPALQRRRRQVQPPHRLAEPPPAPLPLVPLLALRRLPLPLAARRLLPQQAPPAPPSRPPLLPPALARQRLPAQMRPAPPPPPAAPAPLLPPQQARSLPRLPRPQATWPLWLLVCMLPMVPDCGLLLLLLLGCLACRRALRVLSSPAQGASYGRGARDSSNPGHSRNSTGGWCRSAIPGVRHALLVQSAARTPAMALPAVHAAMAGKLTWRCCSTGLPIDITCVHRTSSSASDSKPSPRYSPRAGALSESTCRDTDATRRSVRAAETADRTCDGGGTGRQGGSIVGNGGGAPQTAAVAAAVQTAHAIF